MLLNQETNDLPYVLGRLFAVIEHLQYESKRKYQKNKEENEQNKGNTLRDTLFNAASTTPVIVFPELIKKQSYYLKQLASFNRKLANKFDEKITELIGKISFSEHPIPARLSLEEQGKFILGYYHQVQKRYEKKEEN